MTPSPYLTLTEAAAYLRIHLNTLSLHIRAGKIQAGRIGNEYRFTKEQLDRSVMKGGR